MGRLQSQDPRLTGLQGWADRQAGSLCKGGQLVDGLSATEDGSGTSSPNSPTPMGMCWVHSTTPFNCISS